MCSSVKCKTAPKQSVETHSAWYLIPDAQAEGVDWDVFPADIDHALPDEQGFRGFIVEFFNIISGVFTHLYHVCIFNNMSVMLADVVVQDGYQSVLNLRTVLKQIAARHPRIKVCSRETDGAGSYNSIFVALFTLQLGQGGLAGTIKVIQHGHNEPGHGSDICDTAGTSFKFVFHVRHLSDPLTLTLAGANCIRECWRCTKRTGISIISAYRTTKCLQEAQMDGFIHR